MLLKLTNISGLAFRLAKPVTNIVYIADVCQAKPYANKPKPFTHKPTSKQSGAVAIIIAIAIPILIGIAGLALDLGKLFITKTELQNAVDACALSAANELTGVATQLTSAETAGKLIGNLNKAYFQSSANNISSVTFSDTLDGAYFPNGSASANTKFVKCTATKSNIANFLIQVLNVMPGVKMSAQQSVAASAVATLAPGQTTCAVPIGICSTAVATATKGTWITGVLSPPGPGSDPDLSLTGSFKWIDFTPPSGGASELAGILSGSGVCALPPAGTTVGESGFKASLRNDYNTRFGLQQGGANGVPDYTGFSYFPAGTTPVAVNTDVYTNFVSNRASNIAYQGDTASGISLSGGTKISNSAYLAANGSNRRVIVAPVVDCAALAGPGSTTKVISYACILLLHPIQTQGSTNFKMYFEYLGKANAVSYCNQTGLTGSSASSGPLVSALVQ